MSDEDNDETSGVNESFRSDFGVFAGDLIERYLRGEITFADFCNADSIERATVAHQEQESIAIAEEGANVIIDDIQKLNILSTDHSYLLANVPLLSSINTKSPSKKSASTQPSTSTADVSMDEELLSNETEALLTQIKEAYAKKQAVVPANAVFDSDEEDEADDMEYVDDEQNDVDYVPPKKYRTELIQKRAKKIGKSLQAKIIKRKAQGSFPPRRNRQEDEVKKPGRKKAGEQNKDDYFLLRKRLPEELHRLLGQANVYFVQGQVSEAMKMCHEVIRQQPQHNEPYDVLASFYEQLGDLEKYLQFSLLAAHLDYKCPADKWCSLASLALEQGQRDQAIICYGKAAKAEPTVWELYEAKIKLLEEGLPKNSKKILETKQAAVKGMVKKEGQTMAEYLAFAAPVFEESFACNDVSGSILCLKSCLQRAKLEDIVLYKELNHCMELLMQRKAYEEALNLVFTYTRLTSSSLIDGVFKLFAIKRRPLSKYSIPADFPVDIEAKTIVCLVYIDCFESAKPLIYHFESVHRSESNVDLFLDVADALIERFLYEDAESLLVSIVERPNLVTAGVWLCYADVLSALGRLEAACKAYHNVVALAPQHVNARLSLATLQQQLGLSEEALQTLDITDSDTIFDLDERLLYQKLALLEQQNDMNGYYKCARQFLAMFFKDAYNASTFASMVKIDGSKLSKFVRLVLTEALRNSQFERLVKKVPAADPNTAITGTEVWAIFFKLCEKYFKDKRYVEMLHLCAYGYMTPILTPYGSGHTSEIIPLLLLASMRARSGSVMYMVLRHGFLPSDRQTYWNMMGAHLMFSQENSIQRFVLRRMISQPDNIALAWLNGNNSLMTGTYHHALAEFVSILSKVPKDPLIHLSIAVSFISLASKKDINKRHDICIQGLCFINKYVKLRGDCQESYYNIARALHQLGLTYAAIHYYEKVLSLEPPVKDPENNSVSEMFDLRRMAAHNLSLIYSNSNNKAVARSLLEKYCTI